MKEHRTHLAHKAEHAVDLETGGISRVHPGSSAASAGLYAGDLLLGIDGQTLAQQNGAAVFRSLNEKVGQTLKLRIRRGGDERELDMKLGSREEVTYRIVNGNSPTPEQLKIRESWLKR